MFLACVYVKKLTLPLSQSLLDKEEFFRAIIEHSSRKHDYHESAATSRLDEELDRYWKVSEGFGSERS